MVRINFGMIRGFNNTERYKYKLPIAKNLQSQATVNHRICIRATESDDFHADHGA